MLELVQTMRHFQILSKTVSIGGADNQNMDILAQEIHEKYEKALDEFRQNVSDVMNFDTETKNFEISFFHLRTTIKVRFRFILLKFLRSNFEFYFIGARKRIVENPKSKHQTLHNHSFKIKTFGSV